MSLHYVSDIELLSELIGKDAVKEVYKGSLRNLMCSSAPDANLYMLYVAREVMKRACIEDLTHGPSISSPLAVKSYLRTVYLELKCEVFICLFMDVKNRLIAVEEMFRGTLSYTAVHPREIVRRALELNAAGIIFSHNHPSGSSEPSPADISLTNTLKLALAIVDVRVLDHLIVAGVQVTSFAETGLL